MKKILFSALLLGALTIASCNKDETIIGYQIPKDVKTDFATRYNGATQTAQTTWDRDGNKVYIDFVDADFRTGTAVYVDHQWCRTILERRGERDLPADVLKAFLRSDYVESLVNGFESIVEVDQALMSHKVYLLTFRVGEDEESSALHTMAISDDGLVLRTFASLVDDQKDASPQAADISWLGVNYRGGIVEGCLQHGGHIYYYLLHNGVVKQVDFLRGTSANTWAETRYTLPDDTNIPVRVLTVLKAQDPDFEYDEVEVVETSKGTSYIFTNTSRSDCQVTYRVNDY